MAAPAAAAPVIPALAIGLLGAAIFLVCLGLRGAWLFTFGHLFTWLANKRISLGRLGSYHPLRFLESVSNDVANWLLHRAGEGEALMGYMFHAAARIAEWMARETADLAAETLHWATWLQRSHLPKWVKALIYATFPPALIARLVHAATTATLPRIERVVRVKWRGLTRRQVAAMIAAAAGVVVTHLPGKTIIQRVREVERVPSRLRKRVKRLEGLLSATGAAALVAVAFRRMGLNWLRCRNVSKVGRGVCRMDTGLLNLLLGTGTAVFALSHLCDLVGYIQRAATFALPAILALVNETEGYVCGGRASLPSGVEASDGKRVAALPTGL